jgi:hypothetical protein
MAVKATTLEEFNLIVLKDKSGSMAETDAPNGLTRWKYTEEFIKPLVGAFSEFDPDGIDVAFFNNQLDVIEGVTKENFSAEWNKRNPAAGTHLAPALEWAFDLHFKWKAKGEGKSTLILVVTDGEPQDRAKVAPVIIGASKKMDRDEELAVLFLQVGKDSGATEFLRSLDDDLQGKGAKFDLVDSRPIESVAGMTPNQLIESAFND